MQLNKLAFTLIELLVVIAIIGILSGLIVVSIGGVTQKANIAKAQVFSNSLRNSLMANIVGEWKFDGTGVLDGAAADATYTKDSWKNVSNCSINSDPTVLSGSNCVSGSCLSFDGDDNINCGTSSDLLFAATDDVTISLWFKKESTQPTYPIILGRGDWNTNNSYTIHIYSGYLSFCMGMSWGAGPKLNLSSVQSDVWHHVVGVAKANQQKLYFDGNWIIDSNVAKASVTAATSMFIGGGQTGTFFKGSIDDVRIYNAAMSSSQIKEQYHYGLNNLFINGGIGKEEYLSRLNDYASSN